MKKIKHSNHQGVISLLLFFTIMMIHFSASAQEQSATSERTKNSKEERLLQLLSEQEIAMLNNVVNGKSDLHEKLLSSNFILQSSSNKEFTKKSFIEAYIINPKTKFESLSANKFRIVNANENTLTLTCIETIKLKDTIAKNVLVIAIFTKENNIWKLMYKKAVNQ